MKKNTALTALRYFRQFSRKNMGKGGIATDFVEAVS